MHESGGTTTRASLGNEATTGGRRLTGGRRSGDADAETLLAVDRGGSRFAALPPAEASEYMRRCVASGLWDPNGAGSAVDAS